MPPKKVRTENFKLRTDLQEQVSWCINRTVDYNFQLQFVQKKIELKIELKLKLIQSMQISKSLSDILFICNCLGNRFWLLLIQNYARDCFKDLAHCLTIIWTMILKWLSKALLFTWKTKKCQKALPYISTWDICVWETGSEKSSSNVFWIKCTVYSEEP